jgi:hypothetical protein
MMPDDDLVVLGHGPLVLLDPEHLSRPIPILNDGFHRPTPYCFNGQSGSTLCFVGGRVR